MQNSKISRKISHLLMPALEDDRQQQVNAVGDMGKKRDRMLQDKTNVDILDQPQEKKRRRKESANMEERKQIPPEELTHISSKPSLGAIEVQEPQSKPPALVYPCDAMRFKQHGHLFASDYFEPIIRAMSLDEEKSGSLYPSPNYFLGKSDIRP